MKIFTRTEIHLTGKEVKEAIAFWLNGNSSTPAHVEPENVRLAQAGEEEPETPAVIYLST